MSVKLKHFYDPDTYTLSYIVYDDVTLDSLIIDPVLNYDQASSKTSLESIKDLELFIAEKNLNILYILETHAHADHLSGASELKKLYPKVKLAIGKNITKVQSSFKGVYNFKELNTSGVQFDLLLDDQSLLSAGSLEVKTLFTPGHTPACCSYLIQDLLFTGDTLFMPDYGTGRCDFPLGSAKELYNSIHEVLYKLPDSTRYFTCHDYRPNGRELRYESTIGESKRENIQLREETTESQFVDFREARDAKLSTPKLLYPSIQININAGDLPTAEDNGQAYIKIPIGTGV